MVLGLNTLKTFNWVEISRRYVPSRTPDECMSYFNESKQRQIDLHASGARGIA